MAFLAAQSADRPRFVDKKNKVVDRTENILTGRVIAKHLVGKDFSISSRLGAILAESDAIFEGADHFRTKEYIQPAIFFNKVTPKKLIRMLHAQGESLGVVEAEDGFFENYLLKWDKSFLLSAHDMEPIADASIVSGEYSVTAPAISMLHLIHPNMAAKLFSKEADRIDGFSPRFATFFVSDAKGAVESEVRGIDEYNAAIGKLLH